MLCHIFTKNKVAKFAKQNIEVIIKKQYQIQKEDYKVMRSTKTTKSKTTKTKQPIYQNLTQI